MIYYYLIFILSVVLYSNSQSERDPQRKAQLQLAMLLWSMIILCLFVGFADMLGGYDRYIYAQLADDAADTVQSKLPLLSAQIFDQYPNEQGFGWYMIAMGFITQNRYIFILVTTIIIYILLYQSLREYCNNYPFALILFLGLWFFFTFTYLRQCMGATIAWLSIRYILDRKFWKFLLVWFIAFKFHNSALVFFPLYFVPIKKYSTKDIMTVMALALLLGLSGVSSAVFAAYGEVDVNRVESVSNETGFRITYIVEAAFFLYFIIKRYKEIPDDPKQILMLNMALVFCAILLFFIKSENGGRLSWYYMIGIISTMTYLCTHTYRNQQMAIFIIVVCFFLFNRIVTGWGIQLSPYKTFLTDGFRKGDLIEEKYEYDHGYDRDKFYRPALWFMKKDK